MTWDEIIAAESQKPYYQALMQRVDSEYAAKQIFPPRDKLYAALRLTPYEDVKVVILGQDPYHNLGQAMGLSFSVPEGEKLPPSLKNIYKELQNEYGYQIPASGDLTPWAKQGVLLLNSVLTVEAHKPASHKNYGWEQFTDELILTLNKCQEPIVYMLWGAFAQSKSLLIDNPEALVLRAPHPSPFSAHKGFFGCNHFKQCNEYLNKNGDKPINWHIA